MEVGGDSSNPCAVFIPTTLAHMKTWARHHSKNEFCPLLGLVSFSSWVKKSISHGNWLRLKRFCFLEGWVWHGSIPWSHFLQWPHGQTIAMVQLWRGRASTRWQLFKVALLPKEKFPKAPKPCFHSFPCSNFAWPCGVPVQLIRSTEN